MLKVSNQDCRMRKDWWQICVAPVFTDALWLSSASAVINFTAWSKLLTTLDTPKPDKLWFLFHLGGSLLEYYHTVWCVKTRRVWLPDAERCFLICSAISIEYHHVTDRGMAILRRAKHSIIMVVIGVLLIINNWMQTVCSTNSKIWVRTVAWVVKLWVKW